MAVGYGMDVKEGKDMFLDVIDKALLGLQTAALPGAYLVDVLPFREIRCLLHPHVLLNWWL